jgi:hypothetical protein
MKKYMIYSLLALLYIGVMIVCIPIVIKPGASIFYFKKTMDNRVIKPEQGFACIYDLKVDPFIFRTQGILLFENGHLLDRADTNAAVGTGNGTYSLGKPYRGAVAIYFASSDGSNPIENGREYTLYIPLNLISRLNGIVILVILASGLAWFLFFTLAIPEHRQALVGSPGGIFMVLDRFFKHVDQTIGSDTGPLGKRIVVRALFWKRLFSATVMVSFFYVFMEWFFFVSMPSFMSILSLAKKAGIVVLSGLAFSILSLLALAVFIGLDLIALAVRRSNITLCLGPILPAAILSALALILIDNFTYTLFKFGIGTSSGVWRGIYELLFISLLIYIYIQMLKFFGLRRKGSPDQRSTNRLLFVALGLLVLSSVWAVTGVDRARPTSPDRAAAPVPACASNAGTCGALAQATRPPIRRPTILLLGGDGLSTADMSVYGYGRDTTPRLLALAKDSLLAENAFTNSGNSYGSVASILTGKLPTQTRVEFLPDILAGVNAFQHLPAILRDQGYKLYQFGVPYYVDATSINMQNGFDEVNGATQNETKVWTWVRELGYDNPAYFLDRITGRISARILHIFFIREMVNPLSLVLKPVERQSDEDKLRQILTLIDHSEVPLFIHVHLMGTHGSFFKPVDRLFSKGQQPDQPWMVDFYDDAIHDFDRYVGQVIDHLKKTGQFENTLLIIYTDHAEKHQINERIPLMIHFPHAAYAGRIEQNVENLDIAPTVLDYLGLPQPGWMGGKSFLNGGPAENRLIFGTISSDLTTSEAGLFILNRSRIKPPFYQFDLINIVDCQKWYQVDLTKNTWSSGEVAGHTDPCGENSLLSFDTVKQAMIRRLTLDGFDTSSLH